MNKVFVIDDDIAILELIKINLELSGYNVQTSSDPIKGFQMIKQENPDLIILDVMMPEVDGYSLALKIRQQDATKKNTDYYAHSPW